jgi:hypothetical protein
MKPIRDTDATRLEKLSLGVAILFILPMVGAQAMLFGAGAGLLAYTFFFRQTFRGRGWLLVLIPVTLAAAVGAMVAAALSHGE